MIADLFVGVGTSALTVALAGQNRPVYGLRRGRGALQAGYQTGGRGPDRCVVAGWLSPRYGVKHSLRLPLLYLCTMSCPSTRANLPRPNLRRPCSPSRWRFEPSQQADPAGRGCSTSRSSRSQIFGVIVHESIRSPVLPRPPSISGPTKTASSPTTTRT